MSRYNKLQRGVPIVDRNGQPTASFQLYWQQAIDGLQSQINAIAAAQAAADAANAAAEAAQTAADNADTAATNAANAAEDAAANSALVNSYVTGATLAGTDAGTNATITISGHTRYYADGTSVAVSGGSVTALSYSTDYYIYYDQPSRAGGSVTYQATTSIATAAQTGDRHTVGKVSTPAALAADTPGYSVEPPGVGNIP